VVRETSSRDSYRSLKRSIIDKLSRGGGNETYAVHTSTRARGGRRRSSSGCSSTSGSSIHRCLSRAVLPMTAPLGLPANVCSVDLIDDDGQRHHPVGRQRNESGYATDGASLVAGSSRHRLERRRHALRVVSPTTLPQSPLSVQQDGDVSGRNSSIDRDRRVHEVVDERDLTYVPVARFLVPAVCHNCRIQLVNYSQLCPESDSYCPEIDTSRNSHVLEYRAHPVFVEDATLASVDHVTPPMTRGESKSAAAGMRNSRSISAFEDRRADQSTSRPSPTSRPQLLDLPQVGLPPSGNRRNSVAGRQACGVRDVVVPVETRTIADCFDRSSATTISSPLTSSDVQPAAVHVTSL